MKEFAIECRYAMCSLEELSDADRALVQAACEATHQSYAPYSHFHVGAAVRLDDGTVVSGSNQENAAYPSGLCAERTTLFYANSRYPDHGVEALAIAARTADGELTLHPTPPCGACRQVMHESEVRAGRPMHILLFGTEGICVIDGVASLLPFLFDGTFLR